MSSRLSSGVDLGWFSPERLNLFGIQILGEPMHGKNDVFFITSEPRPNGTRGFSVRRLKVAVDSEPVGEESRFNTYQEAFAEAWRISGEDAA